MTYRVFIIKCRSLKGSMYLYQIKLNSQLEDLSSEVLHEAVCRGGGGGDGGGGVRRKLKERGGQTAGTV